MRAPIDEELPHRPAPLQRSPTRDRRERTIVAVVTATAEFAPAFEAALAANGPALLEPRTAPERITPRTTLDVLRRYAPWARSVGVRDRGQADALAKGVAEATGSLLGWVNADDVLLPGALWRLAEQHRAQPRALLAGRTVHVDERTGRSSVVAPTTYTRPSGPAATAGSDTARGKLATLRRNGTLRTVTLGDRSVRVPREEIHRILAAGVPSARPEVDDDVELAAKAAARR